ncbi:MAG: hypothetical protein P8O16_12185 [Algoriphagus sp.]|uniref:hypothetical protein n=1 Tax=Algoriphagus sp. TaxID=1872435 RepID=UPI002616AD5D|nr:hypothetical protein [Algoriphagus sp.]MDG1278032.1 hypothetical protein [Algoriphagus sp.]
MNERIEDLLAKYYDAETSLAEEQELKVLLRASEGYTNEKMLFGILADFKKEEPSKISLPEAKVRRLNPSWMSWAASVAILIGSVWGWQVYEQKQAEEAAYEEVMMAFALIQNNLSKGQDQMLPMSNLKYLNTTDQIFGHSKTIEK